jgi:hypothetical protein
MIQCGDSYWRRFSWITRTVRVPSGLIVYTSSAGCGWSFALRSSAQLRRWSLGDVRVGRRTREQHIKEGKHAFRWARLSCKRFRDKVVRLQLHAPAYDLASFLCCIELPEEMAQWSLTSLQLKLIKIGARVVRHARAITFQLAEVAVTGPMVRAILAAIRRLRAPPLCA